MIIATYTSQWQDDLRTANEKYPPQSTMIQVWIPKPELTQITEKPERDEGYRKQAIKK